MSFFTSSFFFTSVWILIFIMSDMSSFLQPYSAEIKEHHQRIKANGLPNHYRITFANGMVSYYSNHENYMVVRLPASTTTCTVKTVTKPDPLKRYLNDRSGEYVHIHFKDSDKDYASYVRLYDAVLFFLKNSPSIQSDTFKGMLYTHEMASISGNLIKSYICTVLRGFDTYGGSLSFRVNRGEVISGKPPHPYVVKTWDDFSKSKFVFLFIKFWRDGSTGAFTGCILNVLCTDENVDISNEGDLFNV